MFTITDLSVAVGQKKILANFSFCLEPGTVHALMGPNGSGKSSLAYAIMGHPQYTVTHGAIELAGENITALPVDKRAQKGIFLAFQNPIEIPGVTVFNFLKEAHAAVTKMIISPKEFQKYLFDQMDILSIDHSFAYRNVNEGFSGGEKKRLELLQLLVLRPSVAILDEIDSGLDVDAIKVVAQGLQVARTAYPLMSVLIITHYPRIFSYLKPDIVHVINNGILVQQGDSGLANAIEQRGYDAYCR